MYCNHKDQHYFKIKSHTLYLSLQLDPQKYTNSEVLIRPMWDNTKIHEEVGLPMHLAWNKGQSSATVDALITQAEPFNRA